jgi:hypothetical protein
MKGKEMILQCQTKPRAIKRFHGEKWRGSLTKGNHLNRKKITA